MLATRSSSLVLPKRMMKCGLDFKLDLKLLNCENCIEIYSAIFASCAAQTDVKNPNNVFRHIYTHLSTPSNCFFWNGFSVEVKGIKIIIENKLENMILIE